MPSVARIALLVWMALLALAAPRAADAQEPPPPPPPAAPDPVEQSPALPATIDDTLVAGEAEDEAPSRRLVRWNEFDGRHISVRVGGTYLLDYVTYDQDANSKEQFDLTSQWKMRDTRLVLNGRLKFIKRPTTWTAGIMYDAGNDEWVFRMTGVQIEVPEIWGQIFVGRTKEGFSLNKVMNGLAGWNIERAPISDATLPILADGIKWLGYLPKAKLIWNLGFYGDALSDGQGFSTYENQVSGRLAWVPVLSTDGGTLVHVGVSGRYGKPDDGKLRLRARPGAWAAPFFVETEQFAAKSVTLTGLEAYYRPGSFTFGSEFFLQNVDAPESGSPFFHGGDVFASWMITGEVRGYNIKGGFFNQISPRRPVFRGGPGAWEVVASGTYIDLDDKAISGGKYWRFTPMLNWYLSDHVRLETVYGYGSLDRFGLVGKTHFFQTRIQLQL